MECTMQAIQAAYDNASEDTQSEIVGAVFGDVIDAMTAAQARGAPLGPEAIRDLIRSTFGGIDPMGAMMGMEGDDEEDSDDSGEWLTDDGEDPEEDEEDEEDDEKEDDEEEDEVDEEEVLATGPKRRRMLRRPQTGVSSGSGGQNPVSEEATPQSTFKAAVKQLEHDTGGCYLPLARVELPSDVKEITASWVLASAKHLLVPRMVGNVAVKLSGQIKQTTINWMGGGTSLGNTVWNQYMLPHVSQSRKFLSQQKWHEAFRHLLGMHLFAVWSGGDWIQDQEVYCDYPIFSGWFMHYGDAWRQLLGQSDEDLGLALEGGIPGGYRETLKESLARWERQTNGLLRDTFDEFREDESKARVRIFTSEENSDDDDEEEEEEDEESDDDRNEAMCVLKQ
ncbi:hypothetical protein CYMTET_9026 [Cymbomonas tetramitiformis]|uniref:Uncharacterized protein n=1 Tax=Cymbomonas tetramitiformis TaxID=36881 RepID=A0AAE0GRW2_9CHLO|nr:hypothetical protein CYMTET_9026 [Cymbomonas tetramitiformis]